VLTNEDGAVCRAVLDVNITWTQPSLSRRSTLDSK